MLESTKQTLNQVENGNKSKPLLGDGYFSALKLHQGHDKNRPHFTKPFYINDCAYATDTHTLIFFSKDYVNNLQEYEHSKPENIINIIPTERNENFVLDIAKITSAISKIDLVDDFNVVGENIDCTECDSEGQVDWEYKNWNKEMECPKCNGTGYESTERKFKNGKKVYADGFSIDIKQSRFSVKMILKLLETQRLLGAKKIVLTYQIRPRATSVFKIGEAEILCMPMMKLDSDKVVLTVA